MARVIDPRTRTARVDDTADRFTAVDAAGSLVGGDVLFGFELPLKDMFAELDRPAGA